MKPEELDNSYRYLDADLDIAYEIFQKWDNLDLSERAVYMAMPNSIQPFALTHMAETRICNAGFSNIQWEAKHKHLSSDLSVAYNKIGALRISDIFEEIDRLLTPFLNDIMSLDANEYDKYLSLLDEEGLSTALFQFQSEYFKLIETARVNRIFYLGKISSETLIRDISINVKNYLPEIRELSSM